MTNHWRDIKNADLILINGANPAEAHPVGFQWFVAAKNDPKRGPGAGGGAKIIHADPRFTRTSAVADIYARIRTGTDVAYFGGLINYVLQNNLFHDEYVRNYTNASTASRTDSSLDTMRRTASTTSPAGATRPMTPPPQRRTPTPPVCRPTARSMPSRSAT